MYLQSIHIKNFYGSSFAYERYANLIVLNFQMFVRNMLYNIKLWFTALKLLDAFHIHIWVSSQLGISVRVVGPLVLLYTLSRLGNPKAVARVAVDLQCWSL